MIINQYGLHWAPGDIPFLVQSSGTTNLISENFKSPFVLSYRRRTPSPHKIDLNNYVDLPDWTSDPLVQALRPVPRRRDQKPTAILDRDGTIARLAQDLSRMCSPPYTLIHPVWFYPVPMLRRLYEITNLTPIIITAVESMHMKDIHHHMALATAYNRHLVIVAADRIPLFHEVDWITTSLTDVLTEPLEQIGASFLRKEMLNGVPR